MGGVRKKWATQLGRLGEPRVKASAPIVRHRSKTAAYQYAGQQAEAWAAGSLSYQFVVVFVDEGDGNGWYTYENLDLAELARLGKEKHDA